MGKWKQCSAFTYLVLSKVMSSSVIDLTAIFNVWLKGGDSILNSQPSSQAKQKEVRMSCFVRSRLSQQKTEGFLIMQTLQFCDESRKI